MRRSHTPLAQSDDARGSGPRASTRRARC